MLALRIGTVKNSKNFLRVDGPARSMRIGAWKVWGETTASSVSDIAVKAAVKKSAKLPVEIPSAGQREVQGIESNMEAKESQSE